MSIASDRHTNNAMSYPKAGYGFFKVGGFFMKIVSVDGDTIVVEENNGVTEPLKKTYMSRDEFKDAYGGMMHQGYWVRFVGTVEKLRTFWEWFRW